MRKIRDRRMIAVAIFCLSLPLGVVALRARSDAAQANGTKSAPQTAEQVFKNIQVLKGIPADQLIPSMAFITVSLGVRCGYCHVEGAFEKDDKRPKETARKMIQMMFAINKDNFNGRREVTCYSCHRGATDPVGTPIITDEEPKPESAEAANAGTPTADQLLDKYVQALGGADAVHKISTRVEKGTLTAMGHHVPVEVFAKAPDKRLSVMHTPEGENTTGYDGRTGWLANRGRAREMPAAELGSAWLDADFYFATDIKNVFSRLRVSRPEKVGDRDAYVVYGFAQGQPPVKLYFDEQSGLLARLVQYTDTPLGRLPVQTDYDDYRDADGVKVPFRWTMARPGGRFTIQVDQMQQNVPIDDTKFSMPATSAAAGEKPAAP